MLPDNIADAASALRSGSLTSTSLVQKSLATADSLDGALGMFMSVFRDRVLETAAEIDEQFAAGNDPGPLAGIPLGVKDLICTAEGPTTAQSLVQAPEWSQAQGDAPVVQNLRAAGAVILGKLTLSEFATGMPEEDLPFPIPRNPWNPERWTGGSSSGSGSSVAVGAGLGALGSDTGGSIRTPAAHCGITGFIPTYGRVSKAGCVPLGYTVDRVGPMARSAADCALLLNSMASYNPSEPPSVKAPAEDFLAGLTGDLSGLTIAVDDLERTASTPSDPAVLPCLEQALEVLQHRGATITRIKLPQYEDMTLTNIIMLLSEALAYHLPDLQQRWNDYGRSTRLKIATGIFSSAADYVQIQRARRAVQKSVRELFSTVDLVVTPTTGFPAPELSALEGINRDRVHASLEGRTYTHYWNIIGNPAVSVPVGFSAEGLPLGLQIAGRPMEDSTVLRAADAYQRSTDWHQRRPETASLMA